jgi:AraC-like DNA-binding protein
MRARHSIGGYREYAPFGEASCVCEAFWTHHAGRSVAPGSAHRVLPDPAVSVAFHATRDAAGVVIEGGLVLIGAKTRPQLFPVVAGIELAAIRLKLEWVGPILGVDPGALDDAIVDVSAVRPRLADALTARLCGTRSAVQVLPLLVRAVLDTRASLATPPAAATAALDIVRQSAGRVPCQRVADTVGLSIRHLRRQVHDSAGLSPKTYARALRLVHAMQLADCTATPLWADIAVRAGYCDQSHLIRETLALGGAPPAQLHAERRRQRVVAERSNID